MIRYSRAIPLWTPYVIGATAALVLFTGIQTRWLNSSWLDRYVMGHPVSLVETALFCVGLCALALKAIQIREEGRKLKGWRAADLDQDSGQDAEQDTAASVDVAHSGDGALTPATQGGVQATGRPLPARPELEGEPEAAATRYLVRMESNALGMAWSSVEQRLCDALQFIKQRRSPVGVDEHLKHLASQDSEAQYESYALVRLMVWAIPMLGFLGTVLGISEALGGLDLGEGADLSTLITNLKSSLYVAFDTTALALTYGVFLMFLQFGLDRMETQQVQEVNRIADDFILTRFGEPAESNEQPNQAIKRMGQALLKATFSLVEHQHDLWNESLVAAQEAWSSATQHSSEESQRFLKESLSAAGQEMAERLSTALAMADQQLEHRAQQWQVGMSDNVRAIAKFQENAATHIELLERFFTQSSQLSETQQTSISRLIDSIENLVAAQKKQIESATEVMPGQVLDTAKDLETRFEERLAAQAESWRLEQLNQELKNRQEFERMVQALADKNTELESRVVAETAAREAAERRLQEEQRARTAAEELINAEAVARKIAEQHSQAALDARARAEELAQAALAARKLAEKQLLLQSENERLRSLHVAHTAADAARLQAEHERSQRKVDEHGVTYSAHAVHSKAKMVTGGSWEDSSNKDVPKSDAPAVEVTMGLPAITTAMPTNVSAVQESASIRSADDGASTNQRSVNSQVRSNLLPFPDAKIYRAA